MGINDFKGKQTFGTWMPDRQPYQFTYGGGAVDPAMNRINQDLAGAGRIDDIRRDIEWNNRQKMYDPSYWASAFGMGGAGGKPFSYSYEDTATPYRTRLNALLDNPDSIANTGVYKFAFNQGNEAVNRNLAAKGLLKSGNRLSELTKFGQGLASQQYGAEADRLANLVNATRAGDISKYGADTSRYSVEQQGQNQLRALMMQAVLKQMDQQMNQPQRQYW